MSAEDLTTQAGLSVQQDLALVALLGLAHVERNGHHYVDGLADAPAHESSGFAAGAPGSVRAHGGRRGWRIATGRSPSARCSGPASRHAARARLGGAEAAGRRDRRMDCTHEEHTMATQRLGLIMHGVTGRMGMNQHLIRSIVAIRAQGGVTLANGDRVMPDPILIGRNAEKIEALAKAHGIARWGTDLDAALANKDDTVFFDAGTTQMRPTLLAKAIRAGKHVYCEKPIATNLNEAVEIARLAQGSGLKHGAVQDKLFLPGPAQARHAAPRRLLRPHADACALEFGYWVFEGDLQPIQRPSWNYRRGRRRRHDPGHDVPLALRAGQPVRRGEVGLVPRRDAHPEALGRGRQALRGHRRRRRLRDLRTERPQRRAGDRAAQHVVGHARAARRPGHLPRRRHRRLGRRRPADCRAQSRVATPRPVWNPDEKQTMNFFDQWQEMPDSQVYDNGFKIQWEHFIRHVVEDAPYTWTLPEGAKGVQLVEAALQSWKERRWIDVPALEI